MSPPASDVRLRLTLFGLLAILLGAIAALLGLLQPLLPYLTGLVPESGSPAVGSRTALIGAVVYVGLGAVLAWAGIGSLRRKRWVRPLMLFLAWSWLLAGAMTVVIVLALLDRLVALAGIDVGRLDPGLETLVRIFVLGMAVFGGLLLPAAFVWAYRDPRVRETCERDDPRPSRVEGCPAPVLALSFGLWAAAALTLPLAIQPIVPLFGRLVAGPAGAAILVASAALCAWSASAVFRRRRAGWWSALLLLTGAGLSLAWTLMARDPGELYRGMGYPEEQLEIFRGAGLLEPAPSIAVTLLATLLTVGYMIWIRRQFDGDAAGDRSTLPGGQT